jgi:hypothetical protein
LVVNTVIRDLYICIWAHSCDPFYKKVAGNDAYLNRNFDHNFGVDTDAVKRDEAKFVGRLLSDAVVFGFDVDALKFTWGCSEGRPRLDRHDDVVFIVESNIEGVCGLNGAWISQVNQIEFDEIAGIDVVVRSWYQVGDYNSLSRLVGDLDLGNHVDWIVAINRIQNDGI